MDSKDEDLDSSDDEKDDVEKGEKKQPKGLWSHKSGDVVATVLAIGAYTHAGQNAGGAAQHLACRKFREQHGLNPVIMTHIHEMRVLLTRLLQSRLVQDSNTNQTKCL